ncbi:MAG: hypothetical protein HQL43_02585 [Alphaproteobacteria bacterium]|nr:hypothetical protein [Alphaproteobacteria bacterium]
MNGGNPYPTIAMLRRLEGMMRLPKELACLQNDKIAIDFFHEIGRVIGEKKWSETHVHSPNAVISNGTAYVPGVSSSVTTRCEIWLKNALGEEVPLQLSDIDLPVREGQTVSAVWGISSGKTSGPYVFLKNHTSGQSITLNKGIVSMLDGEKRTKLGCLAAMIVGVVVFIILAALVKATSPNATSPSAATWLLVFAPIAAIMVSRKLSAFYREEDQLVRKHLESIKAHLDTMAAKEAQG